MKTQIIKGMALLAMVACMARAADSPPALFAELEATLDLSPEMRGFHQRLAEKPTVMRTRLAAVNAAALDGETITLNIFPDVSLIVVKQDIGFTGARHRTWLGKPSDGYGTVTLIVNGTRLSGTIATMEGRFEIFPMDNGCVAIAELDPAGFKDCAGACECAGSVIEAPSLEEVAAEETLVDDSLADTPTVNRVRVLVGYTSGAQANTQAGYNRTMLEHVELAVVESNQGYANSAVAQRMELAYLYEVAYSEVGGSLLTDVTRLQGTSDGYMDEIHTHRNRYDADMCCVIQDGSSDYCGRAFGFDYTDAANMFMVAEYSCIVGNYTFAHEFAHTQGCRHDNDGTLTPFAYGHGYKQGPSSWRTIMAVYDSDCDRLNYWSNPAVTSPQTPFEAMGTPIDGGNFANDNESALDVGDYTVINHRTTPGTYTLSDTISSDEYADMITTDALTVQSYNAYSGATANLRAPNKVELKTGFHARAGSHVRVFRGSVDGTEY